MSDMTLVRCCAPTLAGLKTGSLFSLRFDTREALRRELCRLNRILLPAGLCIFPLRYKNARALLYVFRPSALRRDLEDHGARELLAENGYAGLSAEECLVKLERRLRGGGAFPHEIGLFLGYPPEDVRGFMENRAENYKLLGCWKVYGDAGRARKIFEKYGKCTECYCKSHSAGIPLERLAVSVCARKG